MYMSVRLICEFFFGLSGVGFSILLHINYSNWIDLCHHGFSRHDNLFTIAIQ